MLLGCHPFMYINAMAVVITTDKAFVALKELLIPISLLRPDL